MPDDAAFPSISDDLAPGIAGLAGNARIRIPGGEIPLEALFDGERILASHGESLQIRKIAKRRFHLRSAADIGQAAPVWICRDALGNRQPRRDLLVGPDQRVVIGDASVLARTLVNGVTITRATELDVVTLYELWLDRTETVVAEGVAVVVDGHGDFDPRSMEAMLSQARHRSRGDTSRHTLLGDARPFVSLPRSRPQFTTTLNPGLWVEIGGARIRAAEVLGNTHVFNLPAGTTHIRMRSRSFVPRELVADSLDVRRLGICVERLTVASGDQTNEIDLTSPRLEGFHEPESEGSAAWRWTNGDAIVVCEAADAESRLYVELVGGHRYFTQTPATSRETDIADAQKIAESALFDAEWYRSVYPEAAVSGLSPALDFVRNGVARGRDPGPWFSLGRYLADNPDIAASGINPLLHFIVHGEIEGRVHSRADEPDGSYLSWVYQHDRLSDADRAAIRSHIARLRQCPTISVVMPVYETPAEHLRAAICSVLEQLYPHWELCITDDASPSPHVREILESFIGDPRIRITFRETNGNISLASNDALKLATGEFVALMDHDDVLSERALYEVALAIADRPDLDLIYSDEDTLDGTGRRRLAYFKHDWNPDLLLGHNMVSHLGVYRRALVEKVGRFRVGLEGSQDYDLVLRIVANATPARIHHIPSVLYHWRRAPEAPSFSTKSLQRCTDAARRAIADYLKSQPYPMSSATVEQAPDSPHLHRVRYPIPDKPPLVSVIVPTRDRPDLLARAADGLLMGTGYTNIELLIINNDSREARTRHLLKALWRDERVHVLSARGPFNFAAMNNFAVRRATGEVLVFLNNDVEIIDPEWLREMVSHAIRPDVGVVGAKLLYPDGTLQHGGVILGCDGVAAHFYRGAAAGELGFYGLLALQRETSAVTGACMAVRRAVFLDIGGFDENNLAVSYNDVDFCLRARQRGFRVVWTPFARLRHLESASRGSDSAPENIARAERETAYMLAKWGEELKRDPFHHPNFSLKASACELAFPPRRQPRWRSALDDADT